MKMCRCMDGTIFKDQIKNKNIQDYVRGSTYRR